MPLSVRQYIIAAFVLVFVTISFNAIIIAACLSLSIILGVVICLDRKLPDIERDYAVFKENRPILFVDSGETPFSAYVNDCIERKIELVDRCEFNKKFTNHLALDNQLNDVIKLIFHDFIYPWQQPISLSFEFPSKLYLFINYTISAFASRLKKVNTVNLITNKLLDELIKHNRLFRLTKSQLAYKIHSNDDFIATFFANERTLEKTFSREKLCRDREKLINFLDQLCDILQYLLFPYNNFNNEIFRMLMKGIFVKTILLPLFDLVSGPDFINGLIISLNKLNLPTTDTFISVLQSTEDVNELKAVLESVENEIIFVRSKDDMTDDDLKMKQQLGSLQYLKKIILSHIKKLELASENDSQSITDLCNDDNDSLSGKKENGSAITAGPTKSVISITFESILRHSVALEYFIEYMSSIGSASYINFYINVEAYKISVEQGLFEIYLSSFGGDDDTSATTTTTATAADEQNQQLRQLVLEAAMNIYETYLSPIAPNRLHMIDDASCDTLRDRLSSGDSSVWMSENLFDNIFAQVRDIILKHDRFFPAFKRDKHYVKLLCESDLSVKLENIRTSRDDGLRPNGGDTDKRSIENRIAIDALNNDEHNIEVALPKLDAEKSDIERKQAEHVDDDDKCNFPNGFAIDIVETGMLNEHGKTFIAYLIEIEKPNNEKWTILRRYSEFFAFHQSMLDKCEKFHFNLKTILLLPPKTVLSNRMNAQFIQNRKYMLNLYLKKLTFLYERFNFLRDDISTFLHPGNYSGPKSAAAAAGAAALGNSNTRNIVGNRFNPIKTIGSVMKNGSGNIFDGFQKLGRIALSERKTAAPPAISPTSINQDSATINFPTSASASAAKQFECDKISLSDESFQEEENIPLLALLDEVFDLKNQNFWFRRRIIELFKQIIEVTYSDMINRKIADSIDEWTSAAAVAEYINMFKHSFWPNGHLAESSPRKQQDALRRKVAAKALIFTGLSDLGKVVGSETLQSGLMSFFELFQHSTFNLRLALIIFESLLKEIFPHNYFDEIFARLYTSIDDRLSKSGASPNLSSSSSSAATATDNSNSKTDWPPHLSKFIARL